MMENQVCTFRASTIFMLKRVTLTLCSVNQTAIFSSKQGTKTNNGKSIEDRQFETIMEAGLVKDNQGNWEAPLPLEPDNH